MLLKSVYFLDKKYRLFLNGEPWVIQKSNKVIGSCIVPLTIKEAIYSYEWVALIRFPLFTSMTMFSKINIFFPFFNILVDIQVWVLQCPLPYKPYKTYYFIMTAQILLIFYDFCQKLSVVSLENSKNPWRHHFHCKSMKSWNPIFKNNTQNPSNSKMLAEAKKLRNYSKLFLCTFCCN